MPMASASRISSWPSASVRDEPAAASSIARAAGGSLATQDEVGAGLDLPAIVVDGDHAVVDEELATGDARGRHQVDEVRDELDLAVGGAAAPAAARGDGVVAPVAVVHPVDVDRVIAQR